MKEIVRILESALMDTRSHPPIVSRTAGLPLGSASRSQAWRPLRSAVRSFTDQWLTDAEWRSTARHFSLTPRELDVLRELACAADNTAIAETLAISRDCVKAHLKSIYDKMNCSGRIEVILLLVEFHFNRSPGPQTQS